MYRVRALVGKDKSTKQAAIVPNLMEKTKYATDTPGNPRFAEELTERSCE